MKTWWGSIVFLVIIAGFLLGIFLALLGRIEIDNSSMAMATVQIEIELPRQQQIELLPTYTPWPTSTPLPTYTPWPTSTPLPTPSSVVFRQNKNAPFYDINDWRKDGCPIKVLKDGLLAVGYKYSLNLTGRPPQIFDEVRVYRGSDGCWIILKIYQKEGRERICHTICDY